MKNTTIEELKKMSYTDFLSFVQEENRPSGGKQTIRTIALNAFVNSDKKILEIGSTNGFSSIEISRITGCKCIGIDINLSSVKNANKKTLKYGLQKKVKFFVNSADNLPFENNEFDLIICGNALSFIKNKNEAINEIKRVLKNDGFISLVPIWYKVQPNKNIVKKVSQVLGFSIKCSFKNDWLDFAKNQGLEVYFIEDYKFNIKTNEKIMDYVNEFIKNKEHLKNYNNEILNFIKKRWFKTMKIFYDNLQQTCYSIILLRKSDILEEIELFTTQKI